MVDLQSDSNLSWVLGATDRNRDKLNLFHWRRKQWFKSEKCFVSFLEIKALKDNIAINANGELTITGGRNSLLSYSHHHINGNSNFLTSNLVCSKTSSYMLLKISGMFSCLDTKSIVAV